MGFYLPIYHCAKYVQHNNEVTWYSTPMILIQPVENTTSFPRSLIQNVSFDPFGANMCCLFTPKSVFKATYAINLWIILPEKLLKSQLSRKSQRWLWSKQFTNFSLKVSNNTLWTELWHSLRACTKIIVFHGTIMSIKLQIQPK